MCTIEPLSRGRPAAARRQRIHDGGKLPHRGVVQVLHGHMTVDGLTNPLCMHGAAVAAALAVRVSAQQWVCHCTDSLQVADGRGLGHGNVSAQGQAGHCYAT